MVDAGIFDGDLVVVEKRPAAQRGDIVVAIVDNQFTLKRLEQGSRGRFVLKAENKAYPMIRPEGHAGNFRCHGTVGAKKTIAFKKKKKKKKKW